jgi:two-component system sensor histidine kinase EvgS
MGDPLRLRQILVNLIGNAVKFTENGGIALSAGSAEAPEKVHFSVEDTGIGIPRDRLDKIFEPFTQADSSTSRRFGGTGLGTSISKQLAELMGGHIHAESEEGKGTAFHFTVRMKPAGRRAQGAGDRAQGSGDRAQGAVFHALSERKGDGVSRCFKILLAEDIEENILLAKIRLEQHGHTVTEARDGFEAVSAYESEIPDIILMDIHMPGMDGIEAVRRIRELESASGRHVPVIALTASVMKADQHLYLQTGMDAVVGKPIDFEELSSAMEKLLACGRAQDAGRRAQGAGRRAQNDSHHGSRFTHPAPSIQHPASSTKHPAPGTQHPASHFKGIDIEKGIRTWQDEEVYKKVLTEFCRAYGDSAEKILAQLRNSDKDGAYQISHMLKGVAGNLSLTEVFRTASSLNAEIREKPADEVIPVAESLAAVMGQAADDIRQFVSEADQKSDCSQAGAWEQEKPDYSQAGAWEQEKSDSQAGAWEQETRDSPEELAELFKDLLASFEKYNPNAAEPFLEQLSRVLSPQQTAPIQRQLDRFEFEGAKNAAVKLAEDLGIQL